MGEIIRIEGVDGTFSEREATAEEVAHMAAQRAPRTTWLGVEEILQAVEVLSSDPSLDLSPKPSPHISVDVLRAHAVAITDRELKAIVYWGRATAVGRFGDAGKLWALNTLAEHFRAILAPNPDTRSEDERQVLEHLDRIADEANAAFDQSEGGDVPPFIDTIPNYPYGGG